MNNLCDFIIRNLRTIGIVYVIGAAITFVVVMIFIAWACMKEEKEREMYPDESEYYPDERKVTGATIVIALFMSSVSAIVWWAFPVIIAGLWLCCKIDDKYHLITEKMAVDDDEEEEREENK